MVLTPFSVRCPRIEQGSLSNLLWASLLQSSGLIHTPKGGYCRFPRWVGCPPACAQARHSFVPTGLPISSEGVAKAALYRAHRTSTVSPCAFCEQEGHLAAPAFPSKLARYLFREGDLLGLPLRASNEHLLSVRVARAQETNRPPSPSFLAGPSPHPLPVQLSPHQATSSPTF